MTDPLKGYISLQEAADLLGVSRPTVYRRALAAEQYMNSTLNSAEQPVNSKMNSAEQHMNSTLNSPQDRILQLEKDLLAAQVEAAALRATVKAQEAHIDSLQRALDAEQAIHMASLQKRLTAPGRGFMDWIRGRGKKQNDR